jgi:hypothetical protein
MPDNTSFMCAVLKLDYDFQLRAGRLFMEDGDCCDMTGCINEFKKIDNGVKSIATFSGDRRDTTYVLIGEEWEAFSAG